MPSLLFFPQSGGIALVSGELWSGTGFPRSFVQTKLAAGAPGIVYIALPPPAFQSGQVSGIAATFNSGGSLTSGGLTDGMELSPGDALQIDRSRLTSGSQSIRIVGAAGSSGGRLFWELF